MTTTTTNKKAVGVASSNGLHAGTTRADSRTAGATGQNLVNAFTRSGTSFTVDTPNATDWRGALAAGNAVFRAYGAHSELVGGRRARRAQERQELKALLGLFKIEAKAKKASKQGGKV